MLDREEFIIVGSNDNSINIVKLELLDEDYIIEEIFKRVYNNKIMLHSCLLLEDKLYILDSYNNILIKYEMSNMEYSECYTGKDPRHLCSFKDNIYVTNFESDSIAIIDGASCSLTGLIAVSSKPHDIVIHKEDNKLYIACYEENKILEYDMDSGKKKHLEIGGKPMHLILFESYLFVLSYHVNGDISSEIYIINLNNYQIEKKYPINEITSNFAYDKETNMLYILAIESGTVYSINLNNEQIKKHAHINGYLENIFISARHLHIINSSRNDITIIDKATSKPIKNIALNFSPISEFKLL